MGIHELNSFALRQVSHDPIGGTDQAGVIAERSGCHEARDEAGRSLE
jgi:hypothetical protein